MDSQGKLTVLTLVLAATLGNIQAQNCQDYKYDLRKGSNEPQQVKEFVNCWGNNVKSGKSDTIILMDLSGSMGWSGFNAEKRFVEGLLSKVKVAFNATRISIVTFSTGVSQPINYILKPTFMNQKCKFKKEFQSISYYGGMTNIKGALQKASDTFAKLILNDPKDFYRSDANKAIIVITDGYGNMVGDRITSAGSDVTHEINQIKTTSRQIEVYSVALTRYSDTATLRDKIATSPYLYMYKPSFSSLDNLAKNLRGDAYENEFETELVDQADCDNKCDSNAQCGCNLVSGDYKCFCRRGYYGNAEKGDSPSCTKCPANTYAEKSGLISVSDCTSCPANAITDGPGKISSSSCYCKSGYEWHAATSQCNRVKCAPATSIGNGGFVTSAPCATPEFESRCQYRCNADYELKGAQTIVCQADKTWLPAATPSCAIIQCDSSFTGSEYTVGCDKLSSGGGKYEVKTKCTFDCKGQYYQHGGDRVRTCQANTFWTGSIIDCQAIKCPKVPISNPSTNKVRAGDSTKDCFNKQLNVDEICHISCPAGYSLSGVTALTCQKAGDKVATGKWSEDVGAKPPICTDITAPQFANDSKCATGIVSIKVQTLPGLSYANVTFDLIGVTDNSGETPTVVASPAIYELGKTYSIGWTNRSGIDIVFTASDQAGNKATCRFNIEVQDKEKPVNTKCPGNIVKKTNLQNEVVTWEEPEYKDNCGTYITCPISISSTIQSGSSFPLGPPTAVEYTATDKSNNQNKDCKFSVHVKANTCDQPTPPKNGAVSMFGTLAVPLCQTGLFPATAWPNPNFYTCAADLTWKSFTQLALSSIAGCTEKTAPAGVDASVFAIYQYSGDCNQEATKAAIRQKYFDLRVCNPPCTKDTIEVYCDSGTVLMRRKRRATSTVRIKMTVKVTGDDQEAATDPTGTINKLKTQMDGSVAPTVKNEINNLGDISQSVLPGLTKASVTNDAGVEACKYKKHLYTGNAIAAQKCYGCPAGQFKNLQTDKCEDCPAGSKNPLYSQVSCEPCPAGQQTQGTDKASYASCKQICVAGQYSPNGLEPCFECARSTYSDKETAKECTKCPTGTVTIIEGAKSINDCGSACQPGTYSENGVEPCLPCPRGHYSSVQGQVKCDSCPGTKSTFGEGASSSSYCLEINYCASNPCVNGKNCINMKDTYFCECKDGYYGTKCEKEVDECALKPCLHDGTCIDEFRGYSCLCKPGTAGNDCEKVIGICNEAICGANGVCQVLADSTTKCICKDGYTGTFCEGRISPCHSSPCKNDGLCTDKGTGDFECRCKTGYEGKVCETKLNFCADGSCKNGGICKDGSHGYSCTCAAGYGGLQCEEMINMCQHTPCKNGGVCTGKVNDVDCLCAPGYGGKYCDTALKWNYDVSFQTRTAPTFAYVKGRYTITAVTIAFWMRTTDKRNTGTPVSYAVMKGGKLEENALVLTNYQNFDITVNNVTASLDFGATDGEWHHIAVSWTSSTGAYVGYKDGVAVPGASGTLQQGQSMPSGGLFVIGEEQDQIGGAFTPSESFFGDLSQLEIYRRVLSANEIYDLSTTCGHGKGDLVTWADFYQQKFEGMYPSEPSLACDLQNNFREFQILKKTTLPDHLKAASQKATQTQASAMTCADSCKKSNKRYWCRAFTYNVATKQCVLYSRSLITHDGEIKIDNSVDLHELSCAQALGVSTGVIPNNQISASSYTGSSLPYKGRLYMTQNVAAAGSPVWQPSNPSGSYIQILLGKTYRVTGIATQGHPDPAINEWVRTYRLQYKSGNSWINYNHNGAGGSASFQGNTDGTTVVRNGLYVVTDGIRLFPTAWNSKVSLRMEIYGCKTTPQGVPDVKSDSNQCSGNPCKNGGQCYDLYQRYVCVCPEGFTGTTCNQAASCGQPNVPVNGKIVSQTATHATLGCNNFWQLSGSSTLTCVKGKWTGTAPTCVDVNECNTGYCSQGCTNLIGGVRCLCGAGYILGPDGRTCLDINECLTNNGGCTDRCTNNNGGFTCSCSKSGHRVIMGHTCVDIDECAENTDGCSQRCQNSIGGYKCLCDAGYTLASDNKKCVHITCPTLPSVANGKFVIENNAKATYTCNAGYKLSGSPVRHCLVTAVWSGSNPVCMPVHCLPLSAKGVNLQYSTNNYNAVARFTCNSGLNLIGSSSRTCQQSGLWSGEYPRCAKAGCPPLTSSKIINGRFLGVAVHVGAVVRAECNIGYKLREPNLEFRTCQSSKQWTSGNDVVTHCEIVDCLQPAKTSNYVDIRLVGGTKYGHVATYSCLQSGGQRCLNGPTTRTCGADGKWSGEDPTCVANACCAPAVPKNSKLYWDNRYNYGATAFILCNTGYSTGGTDYRICQNDGRWTGQDTTCTIKNCGDPGSVSNGVRFGTLTTYNSKYKFYCNPGYRLIGSSVRTCQADGKWSGTAPQCQQSAGSCGGHVPGESGQISHAGGNTVCHWLIQVTQGRQVNIEFSSYGLAAGESISVNDVTGNNEASYEPFITFTKDKPNPVTSNSHLLRVIYVGTEKHGSGFTMKFKEHKCGGFYQQKSAVITSPNYNPNDKTKVYDNNLDCYWTVNLPYSRLEVVFKDFKLDEYRKDYLEINEGPSTHVDTKKLLPKRFGRVLPTIDTRPERLIWIHFASDAVHGAEGFSLYYAPYLPREVK